MSSCLRGNVWVKLGKQKFTEIKKVKNKTRKKGQREKAVNCFVKHKEKTEINRDLRKIKVEHNSKEGAFVLTIRF